MNKPSLEFIKYYTRENKILGEIRQDLTEEPASLKTQYLLKAVDRLIKINDKKIEQAEDDFHEIMDLLFTHDDSKLKVYDPNNVALAECMLHCPCGIDRDIYDKFVKKHGDLIYG